MNTVAARDCCTSAVATPALSHASPATETDLINDAEAVAPSQSDLIGRRHEKADGNRAPGIAGAILAELLPQYEGPLPAVVVRDCVNQAVQDLLGSISAEALPEMVARLVAVRLRGDKPATGWPE